MTDTDTSPVDTHDQAAGKGWVNIFGPLALVSMVLSILAIIVAFNADGSSVSSSGGDSTDSGAAPTTLDANLGEWFFDLSSSTVAADSDIAVAFTNSGVVEHNFSVLREGANPADESRIDDAMVISNLGVVAVGDTVSDSLNLPAGSYLVVCLLPGHFDAGMRAQLTVAGS